MNQMAEYNPILRAMAKPKSMRAAINAMCAACMGCTVDHMERGFRREIRNCTAPHCPLFNFRPYQGQEAPKSGLESEETAEATQDVPTAHCAEART
jgi:hypothetical protein